MTVSSSLNPAYFQHSSVTFCATVAPLGAGSTPTGTVTFFDGAAQLGMAALNGSGVASIPVLHLSLNPAYFRHATLTLAVAVTAAGVAGTPTGQVSFYDGSTLLGAVSLDPLGHASLVLSSLSIGSHRITASYGGDATFTANSSQPFFQQRSPAPRPVP